MKITIEFFNFPLDNTKKLLTVKNSWTQKNFKKIIFFIMQFENHTVLDCVIIQACEGCLRSQNILKQFFQNE